VHEVVHIQFVTPEVDACKKCVLFESVIGDQVLPFSKQGGDAAALLMIAAEQEEDLGLEGITIAVRVEGTQKGILLEASS